MLFDPSGYPILFPDDDFSACADELSESYCGEFAYSESFAPDTISAAVLAGFLPMGAAFGTETERMPLLMPKLHMLRCLLAPENARITRTVRRESSRYRIGLNGWFPEVLSACVKTHGDGWLIPELVQAFTVMHENRDSLPVKLISAELMNGDSFAAGEIGYLAGNSYTSLSGFYHISGAGSVQLAALGRLLARFGVSVWDLGMPEPEYKIRLGGKVFPRSVWIKLVRNAYAGKGNIGLSARIPPSPFGFS